MADRNGDTYSEDGAIVIVKILGPLSLLLLLIGALIATFVVLGGVLGEFHHLAHLTCIACRFLFQRRFFVRTANDC